MSVQRVHTPEVEATTNVLTCRSRDSGVDSKAPRYKHSVHVLCVQLNRGQCSHARSRSVCLLQPSFLFDRRLDPPPSPTCGHLVDRNNPAPTEIQKTYIAVERNTNCSQTDIPGPPWVTSPWSRQKLGVVCKGPVVLTVHPRPPVNLVTGRRP